MDDWMQAADVQPTASLVSLGLDSFGFIELGGRIQKKFSLDMNTLKLTPDKTLMEVATLIHKLENRVGVKDAEKGDGEDDGLDQGLTGDVGHDVVAPLLDLRMRAQNVTVKQAADVLKQRRRSAKGEVIFLLGATGIAGTHILRYLIKEGNAKKVICLVRASSREVANARVRKAMQELKIWKDSFAQHIVGVPGDIAREQLGMSEDDLHMIKSQVTGVVHAAGARTWSLNQQSLDCNVKGLMRTAALAGEWLVPLHFVSTTWMDMYEAGPPEDKAMLLRLPYVEVKLKAEQVLAFAARQAHVACNVIRMPLLSVNRRGGFSGEFFPIMLLQGMFITRTGDPDSVHLIMASDVAGKEFVRQMKRAPQVGGVGRKLRIFTAYPLCDRLSVNDLVDLVDEVITDGSYVDRLASAEKMWNAFDQIYGKEVADSLGIMPFVAATRRAGQLAVEQIDWAARLAVAKRNIAKKVRGESAANDAARLLQDYVRARPELITDGSLIKLARRAVVEAQGGALRGGAEKGDIAGAQSDSTSISSDEAEAAHAPTQ